MVAGLPPENQDICRSIVSEHLIVPDAHIFYINRLEFIQFIYNRLTAIAC